MAVLVPIGKSPVKLIDVRDTINAYGGSANNSLLSFFQQNDNNKWAKWKPVKMNIRFTEDWYLADNGLCGFTEESVLFTDTDSLVAAHDNGEIFVYDPPTGGAVAPMRLGDFRQYLYTAINPIWSFEYTGQMETATPTSTSVFTILGNGDMDSTYNLRLSDLEVDSEPLSNWYFGVVVTNSSGSVVSVAKSTSTIGSAEDFTSSVTLTASSFSAGSYTAYPCIISATGKQYVPCPIDPVSFKVVAAIDEGAVGWMAGTGYWVQYGGKKTFGGQLGYNEKYGGISVNIEIYIVHSDGTTETLSVEDVTLPSITDDTGYYDYSTSQASATQEGDMFYAKVSYGSNYALSDTIELVEITDIEL